MFGPVLELDNVARAAGQASALIRASLGYKILSGGHTHTLTHSTRDSNVY